jgi:hypothetical protein
VNAVKHKSMNKQFTTQAELVADIANKIEKTAFKNCYWRQDPSIESVVIVHHLLHMASIVASFVEGAPDPDDVTQYFNTSVITIVPGIHRLMADCKNPDSPDHKMAVETKKTLESWMDVEVRAFYCPPCYFVQFTGRKWE